MSFKTQLDLRRRDALKRRTAALQAWLQSNPHMESSSSHQAAFLAGYDSAAGPLPPTGMEVVNKYAQKSAEEAARERQRRAALPPGACPECDGEGQLVGAMHITKCPACKGTGRLEGGAK